MLPQDRKDFYQPSAINELLLVCYWENRKQENLPKPQEPPAIDRVPRNSSSCRHRFPTKSFFVLAFDFSSRSGYCKCVPIGQSCKMRTSKSKMAVRPWSTVAMNPFILVHDLFLGSAIRSNWIHRDLFLQMQEINLFTVAHSFLTCKSALLLLFFFLLLRRTQRPILAKGEQQETPGDNIQAIRVGRGGPPRLPGRNAAPHPPSTLSHSKPYRTIQYYRFTNPIPIIAVVQFLRRIHQQ